MVASRSSRRSTCSCVAATRFQVGALGVTRTVCSNSLALLRYKGPIEVDLEMSFVARHRQFAVKPDVRIWTDWNSLEPTCLQGTIDKVYSTLKAFRVDLKREAEKKLTDGLEAAIVEHLIFPTGAPAVHQHVCRVPRQLDAL
jgi:hypothetical protein